MSGPVFPAHLLEKTVRHALEEDTGLAGDVTTAITVPPGAVVSAVIRARSPGILAGLACAGAAFSLAGAGIFREDLKADGDTVAKDEIVMKVRGPARPVLTAERTALNFTGHLSGIATATAALVKAVDGTGVRIACTRKTTPGLRAFEKYAVECGGGKSHRFGLYDAILIKDNHIAAAGSITKALAAVKKSGNHMLKAAIEVDTLDQLAEALDNGADTVLLDNMSVGNLKKAVRLNNGHAILEASGNISAETARAVAQTGVDIISSGSITHSAPCLDLGMDFLQTDQARVPAS